MDIKYIKYKREKERKVGMHQGMLNEIPLAIFGVDPSCRKDGRTEGRKEKVKCYVCVYTVS
jgi:menaquinone-dependent protoporphyrinogen IX oxidase